MKSSSFTTLAAAAGVALAVALPLHDAGAAVKAQAVAYKQGDTALQGYIAYDDAAKGKRPGVVVFPDWYGVTDYSEARARKLAALGYVVFVGDLFGKDIRPKTDPEAMAAVGQFRGDPKLLPARYEAAMSRLRADPHVDQGKIVTMGYCFGARPALGIARSGADVAATVTFHGDVANPDPASAKNIKGHVLVFWGANDPHVTAKAMAGFEDEMRQTKADWEVVTFGNTVHSFTVPTAHSESDAYSATADQSSWRQMQDFLRRVLK